MAKRMWSKKIVLIQFVISFFIVTVVTIYANHFIGISMSTMEDNIRHRIIAVSKILSQMVEWGAWSGIDGHVLDQYRDVADMEQPSYWELRIMLGKFAQENDVLNAYFVRNKDGRLQYIAYNDANGEGNIGLNTRTVSYRDSPWIKEALDGKSICSELGYHSLGRANRMTALSPVYHEGKIVALAGVDIDDSSIVKARRMVTFLAVVLLIMVVIVFVSGVFNMLNLQKEAEKARAASMAKSNFLSQMSHEIRTPLNAIIGMGELALYSETMPKALEYVRGIKQAGQNLLSLINDILDFSKIETGSLQIVEAQYSLASLLNDVINVIQIRLTEKPIIFTVNVDPNLPARLNGDELRMRQVLFNLLSNATKYTRQGVINLRVTYGTRLEEKDNPSLVVTVTDTGIGIKKEDLANLFSNFVRFDMAKNKSIEGSGLGLAITRSLCRAMGGDITVTSEYGKGSVFTATIPQAVSGIEKLAVVDNPRAKIILLYDHRPEYVKSLNETLLGIGVTVVIASSKEEFLEKLASGHYSFAFVSEVALDQAQEVIARRGSGKTAPIVLVLLSDIGKVAASENVMVIPMPAYAVPVANVINGKGRVLKDFKDASANFITPDARILVVDDIPANLVVAEGLLSPYKARIDTCSSGAGALELVKMQHYDLVFMDHMMPEMDGIEAVKLIRQWEKANGKNKMPVVALTANAVSGMREMFLQKEFNDYLSKPIDVFMLHAIMNSWIPVEKHKQKTAGEAVEEKAEPIPEMAISGIDLQEGQKRYKGNVYLDVLRAWHTHTPGLLEKLGRLQKTLSVDPLAEKDLGDYIISVHGLKGSTYGICAAGAGKKAEDLEAAARRKDIDFVMANTAPLINEASALLLEIGKLLDAAAQQAGPKSTQQSPDAGLLSEFYAACKQYKSNQMEEILKKLEESQYESGGDLIQWLREQTDNLEYDAICERLEAEKLN